MQSKKYILSIDQGTTSTKALLFDKKGNLVAISHSTTHSLFYPQNGFVEQDADEIYQELCRISKDVIKKAGATKAEVACMSLSVQTGVWLFWDTITCKPVYNLIGWQCSRGQEIVDKLTKEEQDYIKKLTGNPMNAQSIAAKMQWVFDHVDGMHDKVKLGKVKMGSDEGYLIYRLTRGECYPIEYNNACTTEMFDFKSMDWDERLLQKFHVTRDMLPNIMSSDSCFGVIKEEGLDGIPIYGVLWDSVAALFSHRGYSIGNAKASYGTGTTIIVNVGNEFPDNTTDRLTVGWGMKGKVTYLRHANALCTGATIKWLVDSLGLIKSSSESESVAASVNDTDGVYLVPAFSGLAAPYFDDKARACIVGMTRATTKAHIVRAGLESIAYQVKAMLDSTLEVSEYKCEKLYADSGASANKLLMQFQADLLGMKVISENIPEASGVGMAYFGGMSSGFFNNLEDLVQLGDSVHEYMPAWDEETRQKHYKGWQDAVQKSHCNL